MLSNYSLLFTTNFLPKCYDVFAYGWYRSGGIDQKSNNLSPVAFDFRQLASCSICDAQSIIRCIRGATNSYVLGRFSSP